MNRKSLKLDFAPSLATLLLPSWLHFRAASLRSPALKVEPDASGVL